MKARILINQFKQVFVMLIKDGFTFDYDVLYAACRGGQLDVVRFLFEDSPGLTIEDARANRNHALSEACAGGHLPVVQYLIEEVGLDTSDVLTEGLRMMSALDVAAQNARLEIVTYLFDSVTLGLTVNNAYPSYGGPLRYSLRKATQHKLIRKLGRYSYLICDLVVDTPL